MPTPLNVTWVLESDVFPRSHPILERAIRSLGMEVVVWDDAWWSAGGWPRLHDTPVVFHGSLGNAAAIRERAAWRPGAYCDVSAFCCTRWYPRITERLLNRTWLELTARSFVESAEQVLEGFGSDALFVRPDSPLKAFSGRVLSRGHIDLAALDFGFYFEDPELPVIVAPVRTVGREWRYVVVDRQVVAGSAYESDGRIALADDPGGSPWRFASELATSLEPPEDVYVMDICESEGELYLLELNPFSGADLYACDGEQVVSTVSAAAIRDR